VTDEGEKTKSPPGATLTSNVVALAALGKPTSKRVVARTYTKREEEVFIA
jgi:hypothetical protein